MGTFKSLDIFFLKLYKEKVFGMILDKKTSWIGRRYVHGKRNSKVV